MSNRNKKLLIFFMSIFAIPTVLYIIAGYTLTFFVENDLMQQVFAIGKIPDPQLDGKYNGTASPQFNWTGKTFDSENNSGINNFSAGDNIVENVPFKTYIGKGLRDGELDVLKIDYDLPENPFYVRWILDEVVEVVPGKYLGKVHVRLLPFVPFTMMYFRLEK